MQVFEFDNKVIRPYPPVPGGEFHSLPSVVTIGSFDGVHRGHRIIIDRLVSIARTRGLRSVVVTFEPHPRLVLGGGKSDPVGLLTTLEEKIGLLGEAGIDMLLVIRFTLAFAARSSEDFIRKILSEMLAARSIVVGYDHGFGRGRSGSGHDLCRLGRELGFDVEEVQEVRIGDEHFSSTRIRHLLEEGRIAEANVFLGSPYRISGTVEAGDGRGRELGFPTVNLRLQDPCKLLPHSGVYWCSTLIGGKEYRAMMNIGVRPTVDVSGRKGLEAHILGWSGSLYGEVLQFRLLGFLRPERRFASLEELRRQLEKDKKTVEMYS